MKEGGVKSPVSIPSKREGTCEQFYILKKFETLR